MSTLPSRLEALRVPPLLSASGLSEDPKGTAYHLTLDANNARHPTTTGISAPDRALASRLIAEGAGPEEFTRPGHLVTLRYTVGGTRVRVGHTEAAVGEWWRARAAVERRRYGDRAAGAGGRAGERI